MKKLLIVFVLSLLFSVSACGEPTAEEELENFYEQYEKQEAKAKANSFVEVGEAKAVGDWKAKITDVDYAAGDTIVDLAGPSSAPQGEYVMFTYEAVYQGKEDSSNARANLAWSLTGSDKRVREQVYPVTPYSVEGQFLDVAPGGVATDQVVFDIAPEAIAGSVLRIEGYDDSGFPSFLSIKLDP